MSTTSSPSRADRLRGMLWGQFVGDAAALGTHWVYDLGALAAAYPEGIRGFEAPGLATYHAARHPGDQTHYGDAALLLLESCAELGRFDLGDFAARFVAFFSNPQIPSYRDKATRETLAHLDSDPENLANGADDDQPATVTRLAPLLALAGDPRAAIEALTLFCQNNPRALAFARAHAQLLVALLDGTDFATAIGRIEEDEPARAIAAARTAVNDTEEKATLTFGQGCPLLKTFPSAVHAALRHPHDFEGAILGTLSAGGDNAARAAMIGAWLGAELGVQAIPAAWREKLTASQKIHKSVEALVTKSA